MAASDSADSERSSDSEEDLQEQWEEDIEQIKNLLAFIVVPFFARLAGRRLAYWSSISFADKKCGGGCLDGALCQEFSHVLAGANTIYLVISLLFRMLSVCGFGFSLFVYSFGAEKLSSSSFHLVVYFCELKLKEFLLLFHFLFLGFFALFKLLFADGMDLVQK